MLMREDRERNSTKSYPSCNTGAQKESDLCKAACMCRCAHCTMRADELYTACVSVGRGGVWGWRAGGGGGGGLACRSMQ